jgi:hypothetical protein
MMGSPGGSTKKIISLYQSVGNDLIQHNYSQRMSKLKGLGARVFGFFFVSRFVFIGKVKVFSFNETQCFFVNNGNLGAFEADYFCLDNRGVIKKC